MTRRLEGMRWPRSAWIAGGGGTAPPGRDLAVMHASLHGIDSHGIGLPVCRGFRRPCGFANIGEFTRAAPRPADADGGMGHIATIGRTRPALARDRGIGMAVVNSTISRRFCAGGGGSASYQRRPGACYSWRLTHPQIIHRLAAPTPAASFPSTWR
jgi:hypothetical protein